MAIHYPHILLVEDDDVDAEAVTRALKRQKLPNKLIHAGDGIEALNALRGYDGNEPLKQPYLILLDLNMPRMNGIEFLRAIRQDAELKRSVVFVLTTSNQQEDKMAAYNQQVAGYIVKANLTNDFSDITKLIEQYQLIIDLPVETSLRR